LTSTAPKMAAYYRADGVRITHDPYAPGMAEKYGKPGQTDREGFDPYADSVGPGIYGGRVKRDDLGMVVIGKQYQNHNPRPGPVYAGGGYTPVNEALKNEKQLIALLDKYPDLVNDVSTGGATPLHMCGMGRDNQHATELLIQRGGDIEALDTYGFTPLHRMASNNLAVGAHALLKAGADPFSKGACGQTPLAVAKSSTAAAVLKVLQEFQTQLYVPTLKITVMGAGVETVNGVYDARDASVIPEKFALVCEQNGWRQKPCGRNCLGPMQGVPEMLQLCGSKLPINHISTSTWLTSTGGLTGLTALGFTKLAALAVQHQHIHKALVESLVGLRCHQKVAPCHVSWSIVVLKKAVTSDSIYTCTQKR